MEGFIEQERLLMEGDRVVVGLSGGADSVCLLLVLHKLGYDVMAAHCNFGLRGEESLRDEVFVRELCERLGVELRVKRFETLEYAQQSGGSVEMAARELRYAWFENLRTRWQAAAIAVGHHRNDQTETFLLNLVRGSGLRGLCGMQPKRGKVVRPLLCVWRQEIVDFLKAEGVAFVTDSTNSVATFARNKIRLQILPLLGEINPASMENMVRTMENLCEVRKMYDYCVEEFASACLDGPSELSIERVLRAPSPLSVLHEVLAPMGFNRSQLVDLLKGIGHVGRTYFSPSHRLVVDREQLVIASRDEEIESCQFMTKPMVYRAGMDVKAGKSWAFFDADKLCGRLSLRTVSRGDRFVPFGMKGSKLVSNLLTDLKLDRWEREHQLVLLCDDVIAWVVGRRTSELFRVDEGTKRVVKVDIILRHPC